MPISENFAEINLSFVIANLPQAGEAITVLRKRKSVGYTKLLRLWKNYENIIHTLF